LFEQTKPESTSEGLLDNIFKKIDNQPQVQKFTPVESSNNYPHVVEKLLADKAHPIKWRKLSSSLKVARLFTGQDLFEVSLHRIKAGGKTPHHNHTGNEYTVVLSGSFSDEHGVYREGDFILKQRGDTHHPVGAKTGDCICFTALESPIRIKGVMGWLLSPFLQVHPI
jgi:putative transcriptional regulator